MSDVRIYLLWGLTFLPLANDRVLVINLLILSRAQPPRGRG